MTATDAYARLRQLPGARGNGTGFIACCPAHEDSHASLSVTLSDAGKLLVHCHAGCDTEAVLEAVGLGWADLVPGEAKANGNGGVPRQMVATYDYTDAEGQLLFQKVRYWPKDFRQRRPDGNGGWVWNLRGVTPVLYNLPAVRRATAAHLPVYFVEGEKDCKALADREEVATTVPGGAGKWLARFATEFAGARVVIVADRDPQGRAHALACARGVAPVAASVVVWESDRGKDVAEHFERGGDFDNFQPVDWWPEDQPAAAAAVPVDQGATVPTMADVTPVRVRWLWPGWLAAGKLALLDGDPGCGKSTVAVEIAARVTSGAPLPGEDNDVRHDPASVLLLTAEDGIADTVVPRLIAAGADRTRVRAWQYVHYRDPEGTLRRRLPILPTDLDQLAHMVHAMEARLVIVDVFFAYLATTVNSWRDQDVRQVLSAMGDVADATGATFLLLRHLNKSGGGPAVYRGGGSIGITGAARTALAAAYDPRDETRSRRVLAVVKSNVGLLPRPLTYTIVEEPMVGSGRVAWQGPCDITADELLTWRAPGSGQVTVVDSAASWLAEVLAEGPVAYQELMTLGRHEGFDHNALDRAARQLGVRIRRQGSGKEHHSVWELPDQGDLP